jgi:CubicO group peptidase (beta-lactamase class C family)
MRITIASTVAAAVLLILLSVTAFGQVEAVKSDLVKSDGVTGPLHQAYLGKIIFASVPATATGTAPVELKETDFLKAFELKGAGDLAFQAYMANSLTNYLHRLAPELSLDQLTQSGSYQLSFYVDGALVHTDNIHPAAITADSKNAKTTFRIAFLKSADKESPWGATWHRFLLGGGDQALTAGKHVLRLELRPYLRLTELKVGELIAAGELPLNVIKPKIDEKLTSIQPIPAGSGWQTAPADYDKEKIQDLKRKIAEGLFKDVKSIVIIRDGRLLIEEYFGGADRSTLHDTRSVGKSFASTMMGIAINDGHIKSENQTLKDFYDLTKYANDSPKKESVTLKNLLTMSSGFDANDDDEESPGNEEKMYPTADWVKFTLDLPMDDKTSVGEKWRYFTAGVVVLGDIINKSVPEGLEKYADQKLFQPLGIKKYEWQFTPQRVPSTAGGLRMSSLDYAKYGQLYKNGGRWEGKQIIPQSWVDKTFTRYMTTGFDPNVHYGYLFWNVTYKVNGKPYEAYFATGNGGNKIFVFKDQPLVVVITATAYAKWYMHRQADVMMERYVLPAVVR